MPIVTNKTEKSVSNARLAAGDKQERDVAFYLRREFANDDDFFVFNDLTVKFEDETAQIDHLILHKLGFTILESKSIHGEVKVNDSGEWSRSYKGNWAGISSPLKQAEMQQTLLKKVLDNRISELLGKILGMQQGIGDRKWDSFCVVSNNCILHREEMPKEINGRVIKSESIADAVRALAKRSVGAALLLDIAPAFSKKEMSSIADFILNEVHNKNSDCNPNQGVESKTTPAPYLKCKKCGEQENLIGKHGRFGYYVNCAACNTNTSMKSPCVKCGNTDTKIVKQKDEFLLSCKCSDPYLLFKQPIKTLTK